MYTQFTKFIIIGIASTMLNYAVFYLLLRGIGTYYLFASALGFCVGASLGFWANRHWTFQSNQSALHTAPKFISLYTASLGLGLVALWICVEFYHLREEIGNLTTILISTIVNFLGNKYWVFRR